MERAGKPLLEIVVVLRQDGGGWALPGGFTDPREDRSHTVRREFTEEALRFNQGADQQEIEEELDLLFRNVICRLALQDPVDLLRAAACA